MNWFIARLKEPSSWRGAIWLLTALGVTFRPEVWEQIMAVGMAVAGLLGVLTSEEPKTVNIQLPPIELLGQSGVADPVVPTPDRRAAPHQLSMPPDYQPKEPAKPIDQSTGWNG